MLLHKLLNPHCPDCRDEKLHRNICNSCETLKDELNRAHRLTDQLLQQLMNKNEVSVQEPEERKEFKPIVGRQSWRVRQQMLEQADKERATVLRGLRDNPGLEPVKLADLDDEIEKVKEKIHG